MNHQNGKNTNITNKNIQIGDLIVTNNNKRLGLVLEIDEHLQMARIDWINDADHYTWCSIKLLKQVQ